MARIKQLDGGSIGAGSGNPLEGVRPSNPSGSATSSSSSARGSGSSSVDITPSARALASLAAAVEAAPEVDAARVTTLQQAISSGEYSIDPDRIAAGMLQLEQELGGTQQQ